MLPYSEAKPTFHGYNEMFEFKLDTADLRSWVEFSNPSVSDKTIRLFHKGYNGLIILVTESDEVYLANKDGHRKLDHMCGRNINRLASFHHFIVAGADRSELILIAAGQTAVVFKQLLTAEYRRIETYDPPCYFYSLTPTNPDQRLTLVGCGDDYILLRDEPKKSLISLDLGSKNGGNGTVRFLQTCAVTYHGSSKGDAPPWEKWSCGRSFGGAIGLDGSAYYLERIQEIFKDKGDVITYNIRKTSILPSPATSVACTSDVAAFLLESGEILMVHGSSWKTTNALKRLLIPPASQIICNRDFFAALTATSIIRFTNELKIDAVLEGETNLLKAFEGKPTPPMCSTNTPRQPVKKWEINSAFQNGFTDALYDNVHLSDITLLLRDGEIRAHKMILSMKSKYFDKLFKSDDWTKRPVNSSSNTLDVSNYCSTAYRAYVRFIYQGQVESSELSCEQLLGLYKITADNEEDFKSDIGAMLIVLVNLENVCEMFRFAVDFNLEELEERCLQVARIHKRDVLISQSYFSLTWDLRKRLAEPLLK